MDPLCRGRSERALHIFIQDITPPEAPEFMYLHKMLSVLPSPRSHVYFISPPSQIVGVVTAHVCKYRWCSVLLIPAARLSWFPLLAPAFVRTLSARNISGHSYALTRSLSHNVPIGHMISQIVAYSPEHIISRDITGQPHNLTRPLSPSVPLDHLRTQAVASSLACTISAAFSSFMRNFTRELYFYSTFFTRYDRLEAIMRSPLGVVSQRTTQPPCIRDRCISTCVYHPRDISHLQAELRLYF